jgi:hypothetical protein
MKKFWLAVSLIAAAPGAWSQEGLGSLLDAPPIRGEGWAGFLDFAFLIDTLATLTIAAVLGAVIAYHPKHIEAADSLEEIEAPKVYILYAVIGAISGILVVAYGLVVGFVLFGIGGLIRFRTLLRSANLTGRVIFVTLIGLTCGLNYPHVAVLATAFAFVLVYILEARSIYRIDVRALPAERITDSAKAYRAALEQHGCRVYAERKNPLKEHLTFIFSGPRGVRRTELEALIEASVEAPLKGAVDWETD